MASQTAFPIPTPTHRLYSFSLLPISNLESDKIPAATITLLVLTTIMLNESSSCLSYTFPREQPSGPASTRDLSSPRTKSHPWASCELTPKVRRGSSQCSEFCSSFVYRHYVKITVALASDLNVWFRDDLIPSPRYFLGIVQDLTLSITKRSYLPASHDLGAPRSHPVASFRLIATHWREPLQDLLGTHTWLSQRQQGHSPSEKSIPGFSEHLSLNSHFKSIFSYL